MSNMLVYVCAVCTARWIAESPPVQKMDAAKQRQRKTDVEQVKAKCREVLSFA